MRARSKLQKIIVFHSLKKRGFRAVFSSALNLLFQTPIEPKIRVLRALNKKQGNFP
jgi:hypothetical protein